MFQLESENSVFHYFLIFFQIKVRTVWLSTVRLPKNYGYETSVFYRDGHSDVLEHYETMEDAVNGHKRYTNKYGLRLTKYRL